MRTMSKDMDNDGINNQRYNEIRTSGYGLKFFAFMKDKDLAAIRLPLNNPDAYQYLRWVNDNFATDTNFLNFLLNIFDAGYKPETAREHAIRNAKLLLDYAKDIDKEGEEGRDARMNVDICADAIQDAYAYGSYPDWAEKGLAGCVLKWGTWEDNEKSDDKYEIYE